MATIQTQSGPQVITDGVNTTARSGRTGELNTSDAHGRYQEAVYRGNVYNLSVSAATATAYAGAAGGTPLLAAHNPSGSGKNLVLLAASAALSTAASGAGSISLQIWTGPSAAPTGTLVTPINQLIMKSGGSVALGVSNAAMTSSTALTNNFPLWSYYWATAAAAFGAPSWIDLGGLFVVPPGNMAALGATSALTSAALGACLVWEEILV